MTHQLTDCVHVAIVNDRALTLAFLDWCIETRTYSLRGGGATGPDFVSLIYKADYRPALEAFFNERN